MPNTMRNATAVLMPGIMSMKWATETDSRMIASTPKKAAAASSAAPMPPARTLTFSSVLARAISPRIRLEMSRLASATRRPMVGSSTRSSVVVMDSSSGAAPRAHRRRSLGTTLKERAPHRSPALA
jgi:hypothetical protein